MPDNSSTPADASSPDTPDFHTRPAAQEHPWSPAQDLGTSVPVGDRLMAAGDEDEDLDDEDDDDEDDDDEEGGDEDGDEDDDFDEGDEDEDAEEDAEDA